MNNRKLVKDLVPVTTGGTAVIDVDTNIEIVYVNPAAPITLSASYSITTSGTPKANTLIKFIFGGGITSNTPSGWRVSVFGTSLTDAQALYQSEVTAFYTGSAWQINIFSDDESGNAAINGADLVNLSVSSAAIADNAITNTKLAGMSRGNIKVGNSSDAASDLNAKTDKQILIGNGTDLNSVAVTGDVTISNTGVTTIGAGKVTNAMLATPPASYLEYSFTLTAANITGMFGTPITLLDSPGANKMYIPLGGALFLDYGTAAFTGGGTVQIKSSTGSFAYLTAGVTAVTSGSDTFSPLEFGTVVDTSGLNQELIITNATAAFATGDGIIKGKLLYYILDFS